MNSVFIFAGTSEGRELSLKLSKYCKCCVSVATEYGIFYIPKSENIEILQSRLNHEEMADKFTQGKYDYIIDATHPFATEVSKEIQRACEITGNKYIRLSRQTSFENKGEDNIFYFKNIKEASSWLESQKGIIFVTTGSKELPELTANIFDKSRLFVRVLPSIESLKICNECGILQKQIIAMQGPFSQKANEIQFSESGAALLLTKESGKAGGFFEKISAANKLRMKIAVIRNPENAVKKENNPGYEIFQSVDELVNRIVK